MNRIPVLSALLILISGYTFGQTIVQPNYGLKSHETLVISKVESSPSACRFFLSLENRIANGYFCADKKIALIYPDGTRSMIISAEGIPVCPEEHKFREPGERLDFILTFPPLKPGTGWVDLVEECSDNCFSFYGITLDQELNMKIDEAFAYTEKDEPVKAMISFISIAESGAARNKGIEGFIYINIIRLEKQNGNNVKAAEWYARLKSSQVPRRQQYLKYLNDQGINY